MKSNTLLRRLERIVAKNDPDPFRTITVKVTTRRENVIKASEALKIEAMRWGGCVTAKVSRPRKE